MPRIPLAKGERQRERVLTDAEIKLYLENCRQPWKDAATLILGTGMRPGEVYGLRWEFVLVNGHGGLIHVSEGKSKAARRILPMIPDVYDALKARHEQQGRPAQGNVGGVERLQPQLQPHPQLYEDIETLEPPEKD